MLSYQLQEKLHLYYSMQYPNFALCFPIDEFNANKLISLYKIGIFPWFIELGVVVCFAPYPRQVLPTCEVKISRSMRKIAEQNNYTVLYNTSPSIVIDACCAARKYTNETWLDDHFKNVYMELHEKQMLETIAIYNEQNILAGGLLGVKINKMAYGESMFTIQSNYSKLALIQWSKILSSQNIPYIDCQNQSDHLQSMGAVLFSKLQFRQLLSHYAQ